MHLLLENITKHNTNNTISYYLENGLLLTYQNSINSEMGQEYLSTTLSQYVLRSKKRILSHYTKQIHRDNLEKLCINEEDYSIKLGVRKTVISKKGKNCATMVIDWSQRKVRRSGEFIEPGKIIDNQEVLAFIDRDELNDDKLNDIDKMVRNGIQQFSCYESKTRQYIIRYNYEKGVLFAMDEQVDVQDFVVSKDLKVVDNDTNDVINQSG